MSDNPVQTATARLAAAMKHGHDGAALAEARNNLLAARLERAVQEAIRPEPPYAPLKIEDRVRIARVLQED
jgi:hypothetical protein